MTIPDYETLMLPVLRLAETRQEVTVRDAVDLLSDEFSLSDQERTVLNPSGRQSTIANRTHWAVTYLVHSGLLLRPRRGAFAITQRGRELLGTNPSTIDNSVLAQFPEFLQFTSRSRVERPTSAEDVVTVPTIPDRNLGEPEIAAVRSETPEERIDSSSREVEVELRDELLTRILQASPTFFEHLIVDLMLAMGYGDRGSGQHLGRTNDGGIDGIINEDPLGLDLVMLQAKRYALGTAIGVEKIREFAGSLDERGATRGVFVTTSHFAPAALLYAQRSHKRIILIDGERLSELLVRHGVGVRTVRTIELKRIDADYFAFED